MARPIIIDCDPGHDDAIAILLALANPQLLEVKAITTVGGNQVLEKITNNALKLLSFIDKDIPVAKGAPGPLLGKLVTGEEAHGDSGMDGPDLPPSRFKPVNKHAIELMVEVIRSSEQKVTLVPIGPLTNIALLLKGFPDVREKIEQISLMGGGISYGNVTSTAEFNIYVDPEAARIVFESGVPITMSGLDVTDKAAIYQEDIEALKQRGEVSHMVGELLDFYSIYSRKLGFEGSSLHDPCAIAWLLHPELFQSESYYVSIETDGRVTRGMTVADRRKKTDETANVQVLMDVDREAFIKLIFDALAVHDENAKARKGQA